MEKEDGGFVRVTMWSLRCPLAGSMACHGQISLPGSTPVVPQYAQVCPQKCRACWVGGASSLQGQPGWQGQWGEPVKNDLHGAPRGHLLARYITPVHFLREMHRAIYKRRTWPLATAIIYFAHILLGCHRSVFLWVIKDLSCEVWSTPDVRCCLLEFTFPRTLSQAGEGRGVL